MAVKRKNTISAKTKERFDSLIRKRINILLQMMYEHPDDLVSLKMGEEYICSTCDLDYKRCEVEPDYRCEMALKRETELKELELALNRLKVGTFGYCESCSQFIGTSQLEKYPTRTFCDGCGRKN